MSIRTRTMVRRLGALLAAVCVGANCTDVAGPARTAPGAPRFSTGASGMALDQAEGALNTGTAWPNGGAHVGKSFDANPHLGDAIVVTFYWQGSTNTITTVTDHLEDETPVGNTYTLVDYVTAGGYSMATYIATNVQNFPDPAPSSAKLLAVHAIFSVPVAEGGIMISAYSGVAAATSAALGAYHSATGTASTTAVSDPGAISVAANALVYGVTMATPVVNMTPPAGFAFVTTMWDSTIKTDGEYAVQSAAGSVDPQWTWSFNGSGTWFATVLALNPGSGSSNQPPTAAFSSSCTGLTCSFSSTSSDPDGSISAYSWTFGDGATSTAQNPSYTYAGGGTYTVTLTVTDNQGATNSLSHTVTVTAPNQPPVAAFTSSCTNLACSFTNQSGDPDGTIASTSWTFGDGGTATAQNPSHTYGAGGTYTVTLKVTDNQGATNTVSHGVTVTAPNTAPVVNAGPDQTVILGLLYTLNVSFNDPDNGPWTYTIAWGDGSTSSGSRSSAGSFSAGHTYLGFLSQKTIRVTVTDSRGASGSDTKVITLIL